MSSFSHLWLTLGSIVLLAFSTTYSKEYQLVCYISASGFEHIGEDDFSLEALSSGQCTHLIYPFAVVEPGSLNIGIPFRGAEYSLANKTLQLKEKNPKLKILLSVGPWIKSPQTKVRDPFKDRNVIKGFVNETIKMLKQHNFDGLDLFWTFFKCWNGNCSANKGNEVEAYVALLQDLRTAFNQEVPPLILSGSFPGTRNFIDGAFDVRNFAKQLDMILVNSFLYSHPCISDTLYHTGLLYSRNSDVEKTANFTINYLISKGAPPEKLHLGLTTYGSRFMPVGMNVSVGAKSNVTDDCDAKYELPFFNLCEILKSGKLAAVRDSEGAFARSNGDWISFDDASDILAKINYIKTTKLGGAMVWDIAADDYNGQHCCGEGYVYPLVKLVAGALNDAGVDRLCPNYRTPNPWTYEQLVSPARDGTEKDSKSKASIVIPSVILVVMFATIVYVSLSMKLNCGLFASQS